MRYRHTVPAIILGLLAHTCGSPQPHDTAPQVEDVTGITQCTVVKNRQKPMLVEWPAVEKAALQTQAANSVVVVRYDSCQLKVLDRCTLDGAYEFMETSRAKDGFSIRNSSELFAKLPLGAVSLEGLIQSGTSLSLSYVAVGTKTTRVKDVKTTSLEGSCDGATHYVKTMVVGAYELSSDKMLAGGAGVEVGPAGAGGNTKKESQVLKSDGDVAMCLDRATPADDKACQAIVQLLLQPVAEAGESSTPPPVNTDKEGDSSTVVAGLEWVQSWPADVHFTKTEITVSQYRACVDAGSCSSEGVTMPSFDSQKLTKSAKYDSQEQPDFAKSCNYNKGDRRDHPMNCIDWSQAGAVCEWLGGRLPTRDEWYAEASNGWIRNFPWGDQEANCDYAVMDDGSGGGGCGRDSTWPVCSKIQGNSISGLCDMSGNVFEWTSDINPPGYEALSRKLCGGSWYDLASPIDLRAFGWAKVVHSSRYPFAGVRCVRSSQ